MHIYAFGSICRGELDEGSDIDLLACVESRAAQMDNNRYSVYQYARLRELWKEGNPFAWHLHLEARLLFAANGDDFLLGLGEPQPYLAVQADCAKFQALFERARWELERGDNSATFHLSCIFLAIRNFATCHSLALGKPVFSRRSPLIVEPDLMMSERDFGTLTRARLLSTRGFGVRLSGEDIVHACKAIAGVPQWMETLRSRHERVQQQD